MEAEEGLIFVLRRAKMLEPEANGEQIEELARRMPEECAALERLIIFAPLTE